MFCRYIKIPKNNQTSIHTEMESLIALPVINTSIISTSTTNPDTSPAPIEVLGPPYTRPLRIALLTIMIATALVGNSAVIVRIGRSWRKKLRRIEVLFLNLAIADLLVCLFSMTSQLIWECMGREWVGGGTFCSVFKVLQTFTMVCSNYLIVSIALDRYFAVVHPLRRRPPTTKWVLGAWLFSLLPSYPNFHIFQQHVDPSGRTFCVAKYYTGQLPRLHRQVYMAAILTSVFILPICIIVCVYARIVHVVWSRPRDLSAHMSSTESVANPTGGKTKRAKTFWLTAIVVISFLCCTLPYFVLENVMSFGDPSSLNQDVVALLGIMSAANSSINPVVYLVSDSKRCAKNPGCMRCCSEVKSKPESSRVIVSTTV
ncbi:hypothetical protein JTE90_008541 [Oedothorax gibbosus]|uniref:G-protein coupled receptors family 1 profile domain-containing protein n=1 Tax=Oedothorax gibbosus TaxID=931172 RepID=A0AAV6VIV8_9ARAC|nr:hypothetical protein JTE90_008541 [Oedothorax gibbosus]